MRSRCRCYICRIVLGELESPGEKCGPNSLTVFARDEDEVCVISCDEEDGDSGHGERSREVHNSLAGFHACATHAEDDVALFRYLDLLRGLFGEAGNDWCEDVMGPRCVTDDGAFDGCYANIEEAVFVVDGEAFEETFRVIVVRWAAMREKDSEDWLEES